MNSPTSPAANQEDALQAAITLHLSGQLERAEQRYREILQLQPEQADANHNLGLLLRQGNRAEEALPHLKIACAADPNNGQYLVSCSSALLDLGQADAAAAILDAAFARGTDGAGLRCNRGNAARALHLPDVAERHFRAALALQPGDALANYNLASLMQEQGRMEEAADGYRAALATAPHFVEAQNNLGIVLRAQGRLDESIATLIALLQTRPDYANAYENLADVLAEQGQHAQALQCYGEAARKTTSSSPLVKVGRLLRRLARRNEAAGALQNAVARDPGNADAHNELGNVIMESGRVDDAIVHFRAALAARPAFPEAYVNLANACLAHNDFDEAEAACRKALAIDPGMFEAHLSLGNILQTQHCYADAETSYRGALRSKPDSAQAHYNLGNLLQTLERLPEAVSCYAQALELNPDFIEAHNNLGNALRSQGNTDAAIASFRRALELEPSYAEAYINLALALRQHNPAEAESCCRKALALDAEMPEALVFLADQHANRGQFAEAEQLLRRAVAVSPDMPSAWVALANLRTMKPEDRSWLDQALKLAGQPLPMRQETSLQFAIGKYFDDVAEYDTAFAHYQRANEMVKRYSPRYDAMQEEALTERLRHLISKEFISAQHGATSDKPIFIVGMPRSGTSLLEQILAAHTQVFGAGELPFWTESARQSLSLLEAGADPRLSGQVSRYLDIIAAASGGATRVVDKMPGNFRWLGLIHAALPNARIIHLRRNPVDTCLSIYFQYFNETHTYANDLRDLAHYYELYRRIMDHWRSVLPRDSLLEVAYEDLVDNPEYWSKTILEFLDLPWDARCLDFQRNERTIGTASNWQARQKIGRHSVERWRRYAAHVPPLMPLLDSKTGNREP